MPVGIKLSDFAGALREIARPNRWKLSFNDPLPGFSDGSLPENYQYHIRTASIPGRTIGDVSNLYWMGMNYKIAGDPIFDDYAVTFLNSTDFEVRKSMEAWMNNISQPIFNVRSPHRSPNGNARSGYKRIITIEQLDGAGSTIGTYFMHGVYPKSIDAIELSHEASDTIEEFSVTFSVDYWSNTVSPGAGSGVVKTTTGDAAPTGIVA